MKRFLWLLLLLVAAGLAAAQDYPRYTPRPKPTPKATPSETPEVTPSETPTETPEPAPTPLKMIETDGHNKDSPIKVTKLDYFDAGGGLPQQTARYQYSRISGTIQNGGDRDLKKVTMTLQVLDGAGGVVREWKQPVGILKAHALYNYAPDVYYNGLGVTLHPKCIVEHEELPAKKDQAKP